MKKIFTLSVLICTFFISAFAQEGIIRGSVFESETGLEVIGGNVYLPALTTGVSTDIDGSFEVSVAPGSYTIEISYIGLQTLTIQDIEVKEGEVTLLDNIMLAADGVELDVVVVTAEALRNTESALATLKQKSPAMLDGISAAKMQLTGDASAVEAAKRVTGVSIENGKYIYVRGLGDRYTSTMLNHVEIPGLDPDRNSIQMDIFPTNLIDNIVISKNFTADLPANFTGGLVNVATKSFPETKLLNVSVSTSVNPEMNFNSNYLTYDGGNTDFLGIDDGTRALPAGAEQSTVPTPISGASDQEVQSFVSSFSPELAAKRATSPMNLSASISLGNQFRLGGKDADSRRAGAGKLGYIFSLSYKSDYRFYDDIQYGEFQRVNDPDNYEMRYATVQDGELGERNVLIGALAGLAYKNNSSKIRLNVMRLQNGESRAAKLRIDNDGEAVGQSGYIAQSDNLEYNQRSLTNVLLNGVHLLGNSGWEIDWRLSPTLSTLEDPDIRKTAFTYRPVDTLFVAGAGGNPARIWRDLEEVNAVGKVDITKKYQFKNRPATLKFGASHTYKNRDYSILFFDLQFFGSQNWSSTDAADVLNAENIFPNKPNSLYYQSGNNDPNPNEYSSNVNNTGAYVSNEFSVFPKLKSILGLRMENYVQRHTGRDQRYASGDITNGRNLEDEIVLESLDFFPTVNLIYNLASNQNLRAAYAKTIARPSFKELSFAQILDPITNRIFNGSLFRYSDWEGELVPTDVNNFDFRWELFFEGGQLLSFSAFYKNFDNPIELVRIPEQQTSTEYQPRNVGDGRVFGLEFEFNKALDFVNPALTNWKINGNVTLVRSEIDMTDAEYNSRKSFEKRDENVERVRSMAGQAPYVVNGGIVYSNVDKGIESGLFYNVKGRTLAIVGAGLFPDIYDVPFHSLNFSINKRFGPEKRTSANFSVSNILNDRREVMYGSFRAEDQVFDSFSPGITFGLGLSHKF